MSNPKFQDAESYFDNFKEKLTFKDIVLQHLRKISDQASVEMRGGYWERKNKGVVSEEIYVPDSREVYCNSISYLHDLLYAWFDKKMQEASDTFEIQTGKVSNEFHKESKEKDLDTQKTLHQKYRNKKLRLYRLLFRDLCCFLYRKKYLQLGKIED